MPREWKWYLSIAAVREYMAIAGLRGELEDTNPDFHRAQDELGELSLTARFAPTGQTYSGAQIYRASVTIRGKRERLELTVTPPGRPEGDLPQLVRVRRKWRGK